MSASASATVLTRIRGNGIFHRLGQYFRPTTIISSSSGQSSTILDHFLPPRAIQGLQSIYETILLAVPKKKTSYTKKRMRMAHKYLRPNQTLARCNICERWKRPHTYCKPNCIGRREMEV